MLLPALDSGRVLSACDLCGCLVTASTLRARDFFLAGPRDRST
jgi:hypothetical protein